MADTIISEQVLAPIVENRAVAPDHVELIISSAVLSQAEPGQFAHILTPGMLRRPVSFSRIDQENGQVGLMFQIVGDGTRWLAERRHGEVLDILGPLGHGFAAPDPTKPWCLVGGGVGVPPLYAAAARYLHRSRPDVIIGARTADWVLMAQDFKDLGLDVTVATDDGTTGHAGTVMGPLETWLQDHPDGQVFACGPTPMLAAVSAACEGRATAYVALEQRMGCGIGACLACVVKAHGKEHAEYRRVCTEGPVFAAKELIW